MTDAARPPALPREEITALLAAYEAEHDVTQYRVHGVGVWPLLRVQLAFALHAGRPLSPPSVTATPTAGQAAPPASAQPGRLPHLRAAFEAQKGFAQRRLWEHKNALLHRLGARRLSPAVIRPPDWANQDVLIVSQATRRLQLDGRPFNRVMDPIRWQLDGRQLKVLSWEVGAQQAQPGARTTPIARHYANALERCAARRPELRQLTEPPWFPAFSAWLEGASGQACPWPFWAASIRNLLLGVDVITRWLRRVAPRLVFIDCWYNQLAMAVVQACSDLGIPSVDVQHGLQGEGHFAYAGWRRCPPRGYGMMPSHYWVWGDADAQGLSDWNRGLVSPQAIVVGGNPWLNAWRQQPTAGMRKADHEAQALRRGYQRSLLVTLQKGIDLAAPLTQLIAQSPPDWQWLVRPHPLSDERSDPTLLALTKVSHPGLEQEAAARLPLFALLKSVDAHVTGFSTCALEALALGRPSILLHPSGQNAYAPYLQSGLMAMGPTPDLASLLDSLLSHRADAFEAGARQCFAPPANTAQAIDDLLSAYP